MTYSKEEAVFMTGHENNAVLLKRARSGDPEAESELISCNMGLVKSIAVRFLGRGEELDDLIQLGSIGLLKAARGYDRELRHGVLYICRSHDNRRDPTLFAR